MANILTEYEVQFRNIVSGWLHSARTVIAETVEAAEKIARSEFSAEHANNVDTGTVDTAYHSSFKTSVTPVREVPAPVTVSPDATDGNGAADPVTPEGE